MFDPVMEVCDLAVRYLEEFCEDIEVLKTVVEMQPTFEHLGESAKPLLMKYMSVLKRHLHKLMVLVRAMSTPIGFRYLHENGFIDSEMDDWFHVGLPSEVVKIC
jgi:rapamycin-insensitive companion of mTOR